MFGKTVTLFELFGFKIKVDLSWAFLALLIAWSLAQGFFPALYEGLPAATYWWMAVVGVIGLFASIVLHELSHSLVARRFGLEMRGITLFIFGGVAEMEDEPPSPRAEFLMAIAGPIASIVLAAGFFLLARIGSGFVWAEAVVGVVRYLALLNLLLAVFNMVPAFPLDGGRALRAILWSRSGDLRRATRLAARIGAGFGIGLMVLGGISALGGNLVGGLWWFLIGMFVRAAAQGSYYQLETRRVLAGEPVRRFMTERPVTVDPGISVRAFVDDYLYRHYHDMFPVMEGDRLLGLVGAREVRDLDRGLWESRTVRDILQATCEENAIAADEDAARALERMQRTGNGRLLVLDHGRLAGIITLKDMMKLLALRIDLADDR